MLNEIILPAQRSRSYLKQPRFDRRFEATELELSFK
jgi:hypothetical protein